MKRSKFADESTDVSERIATVVETRIDSGLMTSAVPPPPPEPEPEPEPAAPAGDAFEKAEALIEALCARFTSGGGASLADLRQLQRDVAKLKG